MGKYRGLNITGGLNANFRKIKVRKTLDTMELLDRGSITETKSDLPTKGAAHRRGRGALKSQRKGANSATRGSISMGWIAGDDSNVIGEHDYGYVFRNAESSNSAVWSTRRALGVAASIADEQNAVATEPVYATGVSLYNSTGIIPAGTPLILNEDGTVSAVQTVPGSNEVGTVADYMNDTLSYPQVVYDTANSKAVFIYARNKNSYARVVSIAEDGTITYGTETLVESGNGSYGPIELSATMAGNSVVIASRGLHGSNNPRLIAGTINGTSISFGSYKTIYTTNGQASSPAVSWDSTNNKGLLTYACGNLEGVFFTVSGNSISAGSATEILSLDYALYNYGAKSIYHNESGYFSVFWTGKGNTYNTESPYRTYSTTIDPTQSVPASTDLTYSGLITASNAPSVSYDTTTGKIVLISNYSKNYVVASINSSGVVTYGSTGSIPGITDNTNVSSLTQSTMTYDPASNLHVADIRYNDGATQIRKHLIGSLSEDTVSWELSDSSSPVDSYYRVSTYDSTNNKVIFHYTVNSGTETNRGGGYVLGAGAASSNLTDSNFIGFAKDNFDSATLGKVVGAGGVIDGLTGLVVGTDYYIQPDGSLSATETEGSVFAGTATSPTTLELPALTIWAGALGQVAGGWDSAARSSVDSINIATDTSATSHASLTSQAAFGDHALSTGSYAVMPVSGTSMHKWSIPTGGDSSSFGDSLTSNGAQRGSAAGNGVRGVWRGNNPDRYNKFEWMALDTGGNTQHFADLPTQFVTDDAMAGNDTKGLSGMGTHSSDYGGSQRCYYVIYDTTGSAYNFGNLGRAATRPCAAGDDTHGLWAGGGHANYNSVYSGITAVTYDTGGTAISGGSLSRARKGGCAMSDKTYAIFMGGYANGNVNTGARNDIDKRVIATGGNATLIGNLSTKRVFSSGTSGNAA